MSLLRFYLDEDCQASALAAALSQHGVDATTTNHVGHAGVDDDVQLQYATSQGRTILSNNIGDFCAIHDQWITAGREHAGIILFPQQTYSIGEIVRRILRIRQTLEADEMRSRLEWLNSWSGTMP